MLPGLCRHLHAALLSSSTLFAPMSNTARPAAQSPLAVHSGGHRCINVLEQWIPTVGDRVRIPAIAVWCGWRTIVAMARTSTAFKHWLDWTCARCAAAYRFNYRKWFTGLRQWPYLDKVIATSLCADCFSWEMVRIGAGQCCFCHTFQMELAFHELQDCPRRWDLVGVSQPHRQPADSHSDGIAAPRLAGRPPPALPAHRTHAGGTHREGRELADELLRDTSRP